jgi:hypothetical protein
MQQVQKTFKCGNDIAQCWKELKEIDLENEEPKRAISEEKDEKKAEIEQSGMDIKYQEELRRYLDRKENLREGLFKAYALIISNYCTKAMESRVQEHPEFESKIDNNPIELLIAIKTLMHDAVRAQYPIVSMTDALTRLTNTKQHDDEQLMDYVKRFKQLRDVMKSYLGTDLLDKFIEQGAEYREETDDTKKKKMKEEAFDAWMAYLLLRNSDQNRDGTLMKGFVSQYSLGNNQYPKTIQAATDAMSQHKLDPKYYENLKKLREKQRTDHQDTEGVGATSFAQRPVVICRVCGKSRHIKPKCPDIKNIPEAN